MPPSLLFLQYLSAVLLVLLISYAVGMLLLWAFRIRLPEEKYLFTFSVCLTGLTTIITLYASYRTGFRTVMLGVPMLMVLYFILFRNAGPQRQNRQEFRSNRHFRFPPIVSILFLSGLYVAYRFIFLVPFEGITQSVYGDYQFYTKVANFLNVSGVESTSLEYLLPAGPSPYHYYEIWLTALLGNTLIMLSPSIHIGITNTVLVTVVCLGLLAIFRCFCTSLKWTLVPMVFLFPGFSAIYTSLFKKIDFLKDADVFAYSPLNYSKLLVILIFLQLSLLLFFHRRVLLSFFSLLVLPVVYFTTAPAILFSVAVTSLVCIFYDKDNRKEWLLVLSASVVVGIFIGGFYLLNGGSTNSFATSTMGLLFQKMGEWTYYRTMINIAGGSAIAFFLMFIPLWLLIAVNIKRFILTDKYHTVLVLIIVLLFGSGLLAWGAISYSINGVQFFSNLAIPLIMLMSFAIVASAKYENTKGRIILAVASIWLLYSWSVEYSKNHAATESLAQRDESEITKTIHEHLENRNHVGVFIRTPEESAALPIHAVVESTYSLDMPLQNVQYPSSLHTVSLSSYDIIPANYPGHEVLVESFVSTSTFVQYVENQKIGGKFRDLDQSRIDFIEDFKIEYLLSSYRLSAGHQLLDIFELVSFDERVGIFFYLRKEAIGAEFGEAQKNKAPTE